MHAITAVLGFAAWILVMWWVTFAWDGFIAFLVGVAATIGIIGFGIIESFRD